MFVPPKDNCLLALALWNGRPSGRLMWSVAVRFERALAAAYGRGRVWLAGDAAHLAFPFGVQSMNEGIVEARELATRCGRVLEGAEKLPSLAAYGDERLAHWRELVAGTEGGPSGGSPWLAANARRIVEVLPVGAGEAKQLLARVAASNLS